MWSDLIDKLSSGNLFLIVLGIIIALFVILPLYLHFTDRVVIYQDSGDFANAFMVFGGPAGVVLIIFFTKALLPDFNIDPLIKPLTIGVGVIFYVLTIFRSIKLNGFFLGLLVSVFKVLYAPMAIFSVIDYFFNGKAGRPLYFLRYILLFGILANINRLLIKKQNYRVLFNDIG